MLKKLALKRLTASDLTLFKYHFVNRPAGKQKAINMDAAVFVQELYPSLPEAVLGLPAGRIPVDLSILGPGRGPVHNLQRKILKQQKNWRLNGEYIDNPDDAPTRYDALREGDFAIFEFSGFPVPVAAKMLLVSKAHTDDASLHSELSRRYGDVSMRALSQPELEDVISSTALPESHPISEWGDADIVEDVGFGGGAGAEKLLKRRSGRGLSQEDFANAKTDAERTGRLGEEFVDFLLRKEKESGRIIEYEWTSQTNAISPYDFRVVWKGKAPVLIDAKSTRGSFDNPIHLSLGELVRCQRGPEAYEIYRLYEVTERGAKLRIARSIQERLRAILETVGDLPSEVAVDGFSIRPKFLEFQEEISLTPDE